jgi:hypothetical protein
MDTLLYVGQIFVGALVGLAGLAVSGRLPARFRTAAEPVPGHAVTEHGDGEAMGTSCRFGVFFATSAIVFGVAGLAGLSPLPAVVGVVVTGVGLISVLLSAQTTPMTYRVTDDAVMVTPMPGISHDLPAPATPVRSQVGQRNAA